MEDQRRSWRLPDRPYPRPPPCGSRRQSPDGRRAKRRARWWADRWHGSRFRCRSPDDRQLHRSQLGDQLLAGKARLPEGTSQIPLQAGFVAGGVDLLMGTGGAERRWGVEAGRHELEGDRPASNRHQGEGQGDGKKEALDGVGGLPRGSWEAPRGSWHPTSISPTQRRCRRGPTP
jgi:hypothetical protein